MKWNRNIKSAGLLLAVVMAVGVTVAGASYDALLNTLEQNQAITTEQAAALREQAPSYTVRPAGRAVKDLQIRGRVQAQFGYADAKNDEGSDDFHTFEVRRVQLGLRGTLFDSVRAELEGILIPGSSLAMRTAFLQWREHKPAYIKIGYDKPWFSIEENTSSAEILTVERTLINNAVFPGTMTGAALDGEWNILVYGAGVYTDSDNRNPGGSDAQYLYNAMAGLKLDDFVGAGNRLLVRATYLNSDDPNGKFGAKFDDAIVGGAHFVSGRFDLRGEYFLADSDGSDTKGWYVMPSLYLNDQVQAVVRYEQAESDAERGLRAPGRYVRDVPSLSVRETLDDDGEVISRVDPQAGDQYQALYVGLNYYLSGHAHKLMIGVEVAELKNTDAGKLESTTAYTAWRMLF